MELHKHLISVLMGVFNCDSYLAEAIDSIIAQTFSNWELIICDDGSTDESFRIINAYAEKDSRIVVLKNEKNLGLNATLNRCLSVAKGDIVARMDGDDISTPERFEKELSFLEEHPEYAVVSCEMVYFDEQGEFKRGKGHGAVVAKQFVHGSPICHAPSMARIDAFRAVNGYIEDDKFLRVEDWDLWLRIFSKGLQLYSLDERYYWMRDDRNAYKRRKYKYRINEARMIVKSVKTLRLSPINYIYVFRPLIVGLLPKSIYTWLHKNN